jgi:hypothetical protein
MADTTLETAATSKGEWLEKTPWLRALLIWGTIGIALLFFGGLAAQGYFS